MEGWLFYPALRKFRDEFQNSRAKSKQELQRKLDLPRRRCRICNDPTRRAVLGALENDLIRVREIRVIENIERLGPELQLQSLSDSDVLEQRRINVEQARTTERSATHVPEGPLCRQYKSSRVEPPIRSSQNHRPLKIRIPVRYVGVSGIAGPRSIGTSKRREGESARSPEASIPLPAADQLIQNPAAASEALPIPEWQLIAVVRVELVEDAVGCDAAVQPFAIIRTRDIRWLVSSGRRQDGGIQIYRFPIGVIRLKSESAVHALRQRDIHSMVARGPLIEPLSAAAHVWVRARTRRVGERALRHQEPFIDP